MALDLNYNATETEAAAVLGVATDTLKNKRLRGDIPSHCYTKFGYKLLRYCIPLLRDWQLDPTDLDAQARAMGQLQDSRVSNFPAKRGRKVA